MKLTPDRETLPATVGDAPREAAPALASSRFDTTQVVVVEHIDTRRKLTSVASDRALIDEYVRTKYSDSGRDQTFKELERFRLWIEWRGLSFKEVMLEDLQEYLTFVLDPQPADMWISDKRRSRTSPEWRPFAGPLSPASRRLTLVAIKGLFRWACDSRYLDGNPASLLPKVLPVPEHLKHKEGPAKKARITRYLPPDALALAYQAIEETVADTDAAARRKARNRFLFMAYEKTGCRLSEVLNATMGDVYCEAGRWWLFVTGKGNKERLLPLPPDLVKAFEEYRLTYGLTLRTTRNDVTPLILRSRGDAVRPTRAAIDLIMKGVLSAAKELALARGDEDNAQRLEEASTHWLRHSLLTQLANKGVPLTTVQAQAGHESLTTTSLYLHTEDNERHDHVLAALNKSN
ncbi:site-specific integrase [Noviherbaspirillum agri]